jgi:hypothetical protein
MRFSAHEVKRLPKGGHAYTTLLGECCANVSHVLMNDEFVEVFSKSQEPRAKSQEPRAKSQEPRAKSQELKAR